MLQQLPPAPDGSTTISPESQIRKNHTKPGCYENTRADIVKALKADLGVLLAARKQEERKAAWKDLSEEQREQRLESAVLNKISERKRSEIHVSCRFGVFADYIPAFLGRGAVDQKREELIQEQIRVIGEQPATEEDDDDDDDEEFISDEVIAKWRKDAEYRLQDIKPYAASRDTQTPEVEDDNDDQDEDESTSQDENQYANSTKTNGEDDDEPSSTTATTRGRPLPSPLSLPAETLQALKQHHLTTPSTTSVEKAVRRGPLEKVENGEDIFEWIPTQGWGHRKLSRAGDEGCGTQRQGRVKNVKVEGVKVEKDE